MTADRVAPEPSEWERAYLRFETPEQEIAKFIRRLLTLGARSWPSDSLIVEIFCGRGNGMRALHDLGFLRTVGIDLSLALASRYSGPGGVVVADCLRIPLARASADVVIVQGGLHHLQALPADLDGVLAEVRRILRPSGTFVVVEPWLTPFLRFVHAVSERAVVRKLSDRVDAFATMTEHERETYERWLNQPDLVLRSLHRDFRPLKELVGWGKLRAAYRPHDVSPAAGNTGSRRLP
jgi:SAM-dependent methyltransferase